MLTDNSIYPHLNSLLNPALCVVLHSCMKETSTSTLIRDISTHTPPGKILHILAQCILQGQVPYLTGKCVHTRPPLSLSLQAASDRHTCVAHSEGCVSPHRAGAAVRTGQPGAVAGGGVRGQRVLRQGHHGEAILRQAYSQADLSQFLWGCNSLAG